MKFYFFFLFFFITSELISQSVVQGEYYFHRQEMVAGFNFSPDGKFQFYYSYGAVDRNATGTFSVEGDQLKLKSDKEASKDFTIIKQSKQSKGYSVLLKDANQYLVKNILCIFFIDGMRREEYTDNTGSVSLDIDHCDSIYLQHQLFPDIVTLLKDNKNDHNNFVVSLNPSLAQVSFKGIDFTIVGDKKITCFPNYFMGFEGIEFNKQ